ncbi:hypothetical protein F5H01DRAFT_344972 [Linnemannia elongata]|nr:hypothetical protein F5H01DRAFT_344972 [Linnemannia elongata]
MRTNTNCQLRLFLCLLGLRHTKTGVFVHRLEVDERTTFVQKGTNTALKTKTKRSSSWSSLRLKRVQVYWCCCVRIAIISFCKQHDT